jgi:hypothetical protein
VDIEQECSTLKLEAIHYYGLPHANLISLNGHNEPWVGPEYAETVTAALPQLARRLDLRRLPRGAEEHHREGGARALTIMCEAGEGSVR